MTVLHVLHAYGCPQQATQVCLACGTQVCACHGLARGQCPVCYRGFLSQYYRPVKCGYKGCDKLAVAASPRVKRACLEHAVARGGFRQPTPERVSEYRQEGRHAPYTQTLFYNHPELRP